jgi:hypothetical protein
MLIITGQGSIATCDGLALRDFLQIGTVEFAGPQGGPYLLVDFGTEPISELF